MRHTTLNKQLLILTLGYPGAGKSFLVRQLAETFGIARISEDKIRSELFEDPQYTRDEDEIVTRIFDYMLETLLKSGVSVICDGDFGMRKSRRTRYELARDYGAEPLLIWVQTDLDTAFSRSSRRSGRRIDDIHSPSIKQELFEKRLDRMKKPEKETAIVVSGKHAFTVQRTNIMRRLSQLQLLTGGVMQAAGQAEKTAEVSQPVPNAQPTSTPEITSPQPTIQIVPRERQRLHTRLGSRGKKI